MSKTAPTPADDSATTTSTSLVTVTGVAKSADGDTYRQVRLGFKKVGCQNCTLISAATDATGRYSVRLPSDSYLVVCVAAPLTCSFPGSGTLEETLDVHSDQTLDVTVVAAGQTSSPQPTTSPDAPVSGHVLSGHVRTNEGLPVPGVIIELKPPVGNPTLANTAKDGSYFFDATGETIRVYTVSCEVSGNPDYMCGPVNGDGVGPTVNLNDPPQTIDFILCRSENYPRCLSQ